MAVAVASLRRDFTIGFLSLSSEQSIEKFIPKIDDALRGQKCVFSKLTPADLQSFAPRDHEFNAVVLLHSISQGRNSITDVADAKYSKLLPQLKAKYGPHRVGVIVHSMMSFNPDTKTALMMIFKRSQPTTFKCSNCVIQCGKPAEMAEDDFTRLVNFLADAPQYKLPTCDESLKKAPTPSKKESLSNDGASSYRGGLAASSRRTISSALPKSSGTAQRKEGILEDVPKSHQDSPVVQKAQVTDSALQKETSDKGGFGSSKELLSEGPTKGNDIANREQYRRGPRGENGNKREQVDRMGPPGHIDYPSLQSVHSTHSSYPPNAVVKYRNSADASQSDAYTGRGASSSVTQGTIVYSATTQPDLQTVVKPALIVALIVVPDDRNDLVMKAVLNTTLQEGTIFATKQMHDLDKNWHMFGAILIDVGPPDNIRNLKSFLDTLVGGCRKKLRVPQNVAILMKKADHFPDDKVQKLMHLLQTRIFLYEDVSGNSTVFDDGMTHNLRDWVQRCYSRFLLAHANPPTRNVLQNVRKVMKSGFCSN